jgi:di/tripeptidase
VLLQVMLKGGVVNFTQICSIETTSSIPQQQTNSSQQYHHHRQQQQTAVSSITIIDSRTKQQSAVSPS